MLTLEIHYAYVHLDRRTWENNMDHVIPVQYILLGFCWCYRACLSWLNYSKFRNVYSLALECSWTLGAAGGHHFACLQCVIRLVWENSVGNYYLDVWWLFILWQMVEVESSGFTTYQSLGRWANFLGLIFVFPKIGIIIIEGPSRRAEPNTAGAQ